MSVIVHEGLPGCGKSLRILSLVRDFIQKDKRPVYLFNFKITDKGLAYFKALADENQVVFEVRSERFAELNVDLLDDEETGYVNLRQLKILDGAVVIFDEAQMFFPVRPSSKPQPSIVKMLPTHRHSGYDIHFITQNKAFLDIDIRRIADTYVKYSRMMNGQFCRLDFFSKCPDNAAELAQSHLKSERFKYPKEIFELYVSAVEHNMKFRIPAKLKLLIVAIIVLVLSVYFIFRAMGSFSSSFVGGFDKNKPVSESAQSAAHPSGQVSPVPKSNSDKPQSVSNDQGRPFMAAPIPTTPPPPNSLGRGKPNVVDLSMYSIYYVAYVNFGKPQAILYLFDDRTGACTTVSKDFFMAMGYDMLITRNLVVLKPIFGKSKPFVLPIMPSPCVNQYASLERNQVYQDGYQSNAPSSNTVMNSQSYPPSSNQSLYPKPAMLPSQGIKHD